MSKKGNIIILVLFIMFLSSFIGFLIFKYTKNLIESSGEYYKYYKAYYIAFGGIEIELNKISNRGIGFEDKIETTSNTVKNNLKYCSEGKCNFETKIIANSKYLNNSNNSYLINNCSIENSFVLTNGQGVIIPLFKDINNGEGSFSSNNINYNKLSNIEFANIKIYFYNSNNKDYTVSVVDENLTSNKIYKGIINGNTYMLGLNGPQFSNGFYNNGYKSFLIITNPSNPNNSYSSIYICIKSEENIPFGYNIIESVGNFFDRSISLQAIKTTKLPEYLIYNAINN